MDNTMMINLLSRAAVLLLLLPVQAAWAVWAAVCINAGFGKFIVRSIRKCR